METSELEAIIADRDSEIVILKETYDEYIESSKMLEEEMEEELSKSMNDVTIEKAKNCETSCRLSDVQSQMESLQRALLTSNQKLESEQNLRRKAELSQEETVSKLHEFEGSMDVLRDECDRVHEDLAFREAELEDLRNEFCATEEHYREELDEVRGNLFVKRKSQRLLECDDMIHVMDVHDEEGEVCGSSDVSMGSESLNQKSGMVSEESDTNMENILTQKVAYFDEGKDHTSTSQDSVTGCSEGDSPRTAETVKIVTLTSRKKRKRWLKSPFKWPKSQEKSKRKEQKGLRRLPPHQQADRVLRSSQVRR